MITRYKDKIKANVTVITAITVIITLIIVFKNIYQIFRPITLFKHMLITNQYAA